MKHQLWIAFFLSLIIAVQCSFSIDTTKPTITITAPEYVIYRTNAMWANVSLNEDGSWCNYSLDSKPDISLNGGPIDWNIPLYVEDGFHNITYYCSDLSGNINQSRYHYIMVDATPPQIDLEIYPEPVESFKNIRLRINCFDEISGCDTVYIKIPFANCLAKVSEGTLYEITTPYCVAQAYEYTANATDKIGNINSSIRGTITVKKSDNCDCNSDTECMGGSCILTKCMEAKSPSMRFYFPGPEVIETGSYRTIILVVKNNLAAQDTIRLKLTGVPEKIEYWSSFNNGNKQMDVSLGPSEDKYIIISALAGQAGTYRLYVDGHSLSVPRLSNETDIQLHIVSDKNAGLFSRSPGMESYSFIIILAISLHLISKRSSSSF